MTRYIYSRAYRKRILAGLVALFVVFAGTYAYFLQQTVRDVVERKSLNTQIAQLHSDIGDAEYNYGASVSGVTKERAAALGFEEVDEARYVTRADRGTYVSFNATGE